MLKTWQQLSLDRLTVSSNRLLLFSSLIFFSTLLFSSKLFSANKPERIVSLSLCTDQVLLMLTEQSNIQAISHLSPDPIYSYMSANAQGITTHHGLAEEIVPLAPDLIIGSKYTTGNTVQILRTLGYEPHLFPSPTTTEDIETFIREIAGLIKEEARGEALIQAMHSDLNEAKTITQHLPEEIAISYGPNGFTAGTHTLKNTVLELAGYQNLASDLGVNYYGNVSVEQLLMAKPDALIIDEAIPNQDSLAQAYVNHPALKKVYQGSKRPSVITSYWLCPGPTASKAVLSLAYQRIGQKNKQPLGANLDQTGTMQ